MRLVSTGAMRNPSAPIPMFRGTYRHDVVPPIGHHHLNLMDGRFYDYDERTMSSTPLPRCSGIDEASAVWQGRIRAEAMDR